MAGGEDMRFSDQELISLRNDISSHIRGEDAWRLEHDEWRRNQEAMMTQLVQTVKSNTEAMESLSESTKDVVQITNDFKGAARLGGKLQDFMVWLLKWGTIGSAASYGVHWIVTHWKH